MNDRQRILDRLTKLMAMSRSPNPHEAETARKMAESLMQLHGIESREIENFQPGGLFEKPMGSKGFDKTWKFSLITATARFCGCEAIGLHSGGRRKVRLVGERPSVEEAAQLFEDLMVTIAGLLKLEAEWLDQQAFELTVSSSVYVDSFRRGVTMAIIDKMRRVRSQGDEPARTEDGVPTPHDGCGRPTEPLHGSTSTGLMKIKKPVDTSPDWKDKIKSKYAPKKARLSLDDAEDEGAYWRGYQMACARVEMIRGDDHSKKAT